MTTQEEHEEPSPQKVLASFSVKDIDNQIDKDSKWLKFSDGEKRILYFNPEEPVLKVETEYEGRKSERYQFTVVDPNTGNAKLWTVGIRLLQQINDWLKEGMTTLEITRHGMSKEDTRYMIKEAK